MLSRISHRALIGLILLALVLAASAGAAVNTAAAAPSSVPQRLLIDTTGGSAHAAVRADLEKQGYRVVIDHPEIHLLVVTTTRANAARSLAGDSRIRSAVPDRIEQIVPPEYQNGTRQRIKIDLSNARKRNAPAFTVTPDPAFNLPGLMWNVLRVHAPQAWPLKNGLGLGFQTIKVGVADTGLDYQHLDLRNKVDSVKDFTVNEQPNICSYFFGAPTDTQLAAAFHAPGSDEDFNGHGSWIGGNIAAAMHFYDPTEPYTGTNGIAPGVQLVSLKISQNCGSAYDSTILDSFMYAANNGIDIVSISFGGYLDLTDPYQNTIYQFYVRTVQYARSRGTVIIAAAGNESERIGTGGQVISHGSLAAAPGGVDYFGLYENPGGISGVIDVSSTGNVVNNVQANCPNDSLAAGTHQWCKLAGDKHQPTGIGKQNQLAYYSNYGPRIDFAAPGGARKFNLPYWDRGGCEGWPWCGKNSIEGGTSVADGYNAWEDFSITSNYATEIPCFTFTGSTVFPKNQCYAIIQGTSMATPHVSAVAALVLSTHPSALKNPSLLYFLLKQGATKVTGNTTQVVSATDKTPGDAGGAACTGGWCHLGGSTIWDSDAYGNGLIDAFGSVTK